MMDEKYMVTNVRIAGANLKSGKEVTNTGIVPGCVYYRACKKNGVLIPAHTEATIIRNYMKGDTEATDSLRIVVWNSSGGEGKMADNFAKYASIGKELTIWEGRINRFKRHVFDNQGQMLKNPDGTDIMVMDTTIRVHNFKLHRDSAKTEDREVSNYLNGMTYNSFFSRPPQWQVAGSEDGRAWKALREWRKNQTYKGGKYFGQAIVKLMHGAEPADGLPVNAHEVDDLNTTAPIENNLTEKMNAINAAFAHDPATRDKLITDLLNNNQPAKVAPTAASAESSEEIPF